MPDIEKFRSLLDEFGVEYTKELYDFGHDTGIAVICQDGDSKVTGYCGFYTDFVFDTDGKFVRMGAWE